MSNNVISALEEQFRKDCTVIDLRYEYPNYIGIERYAVISDLDQGYIEEVYSSELVAYKPYIFMTRVFLDIRRDFINNNKKYEMRSLRSESVFNFENSETEAHHSEVATPDFVDKWVQSNELREALMILTENEKDRIVAKYINGMTLEKIGNECDCSPAAVFYSIDKAIKKLKKFYGLT